MNVSHKSRRRRAGLMALCVLATCGAMLPENSVQQTVSADSFGLYGDLDGNGMVNAMDLQLLKSYVLGIITSFPAGDASFGGCGGDWGQRLSDDAYLNIINSGFGIHVLEHELGHGFGLTDFYGGEGEKGGFPPGGFPGGENSLMMAGSASKITDFDSWMLRYVWSKIKDESGRFS